LIALNAALNGRDTNAVTVSNAVLSLSGRLGSLCQVCWTNCHAVSNAALDSSRIQKTAPTTESRTAKNPYLIASQWSIMNLTAKPIGPVRIASSSGQLSLTQSQTNLIADHTALNAPVTMFRNVSLFFHSRMMPATRAATATMMIPIGFALNAALSSHCTAVHAMVAARMAI